MMRPRDLENVCLYDFLSRYFVGRKGVKSLKWFGDHPSNGNVAVTPLKDGKFRIPLITYRDFKENTTYFEGDDLVKCDIPDEKCTKYYAMEDYSRSACILFIPFRDVEKELTVDGCFLLKFREFVAEGRLLSQHARVLQNIHQDCWNSLNAGRLEDHLERFSKCPCETEKTSANGTDEEQHELTNEAFADILDNSTSIDSFDCPKFRNRNRLFSFSTSQTRDFGRHSCGKIFGVSSHMGKNMTDCESVFLQNVQPFAAPFSAGNSFQNTRVSAAALHRLSLKKTTRIVDTIGNMQLPVANGTLANIRQYSKCLFGDDEDQRQTFECLTASFVLKLYQRARAEETSLESTKKRFLNTEKSVLEKVNR